MRQKHRRLNVLLFPAGLLVVCLVTIGAGFVSGLIVLAEKVTGNEYD